MIAMAFTPLVSSPSLQQRKVNLCRRANPAAVPHEKLTAMNSENRINNLDLIFQGRHVPLYEYQCKKCHSLTERIQKFSDPPLTVCPHCGGELEQLLSAPAVQFKGSGWYVTDYSRKSGKSESASTADDSKGSPSSAGKSESAKSESTKSESSKSEATKSGSRGSQGDKQ